MLYRAFISYSHAEDGARAPALQAALQKIARPWYRRRALRVFRDETNLSASPHLWPDIEVALSQCEWFILMASPRSAASKWVTRELEWWFAHRPADHVLIVRSAGDIEWDDHTPRGDFDWHRTTALPRVLSGRFEREPLHVDLTWATTAEALSPHHAGFRGAALRIAARLHGKSPDDIESEDIRVHRRNIAWAWAAGTLVTGAAVVAFYQAVFARRAQASAEQARDAEREARKIAEEQRQRAEDALAQTQRELLRAQIAELGNVRRRIEERAAPDREAELAAIDAREAVFVRELQGLLARAIGFRGDLQFLMRWEGESRRAVLLPGGEVSLPPATSLAFVKPEVVRRRYETLLSPRELDAVVALAGQRGSDELVAPHREVLQRIELAPPDVARLVPEIVEDYWRPLVTQRPELLAPDVPAAVHTALLSLSFNVGASRALRTVGSALAERRWDAVASAIEGLGAKMPFPGLKRRRAAEAALIRDELSRR